MERKGQSVCITKIRSHLTEYPKEDREWFKQYLGKVAFEFICDKVETIPVDSEYYNAILKDSCLTMDEIINSNGKI